MPNRLAAETSPYLLGHRDNPVDWYPWGQEALARARAEERPILLSIGYSACHWCHVMERESFENPDIARLMNQWFVNIKVDREERPDLDGIYMQAVQALTGQGGWPMTVFLTPESGPLTPALLDDALRGVLSSIDWAEGGFGGAPKFPQPMTLEFLLRQYVRTGSAQALGAV